MSEPSADLTAYVPMLARMASFEQWTGKSIPEHLHDLCEANLAAGKALMVAVTTDGIAPGYTARPAEAAIVRPRGEVLPASAESVLERIEEANDR